MSIAAPPGNESTRSSRGRERVIVPRFGQPPSPTPQRSYPVTPREKASAPIVVWEAPSRRMHRVRAS